MTDLTPAVVWMKTNFGNDINTALAGKPFTIDLVIAIALQETSYLWSSLIKTKTTEEILALCVGDTFDAPNRSVFPTTKADLLAAPNGQAIFDVAREALVNVGTISSAYRKVAANNPNKFCHGFGIFQYDIQFCKDDPDFFLQKQWSDFGECMTRCVAELTRCSNHLYPGQQTLTDDEQVYVGIGYNVGPGNVKKGAGYSQGFKSDDGRRYGDNINDYMQLSKTVNVTAAD